MSKSGRSVQISYGSDKKRIQRVDNGSKTTTYVGDLYEKVEQGSDITHTHYLGASRVDLKIAQTLTIIKGEGIVMLALTSSEHIFIQ